MGRMTISEAVLYAGIMALFGITILGFFNPLSAFLGTAALVSYAFVYTPFKRFSPLAVWIGAIPGALPVLIGTSAFQGEITSLALVLFAVQFFWQLPHFWAIGWMSYDDYKLAGYKLLPVKDQVRDSRIGLSSFIWTLPLIGICIIPFFTEQIGIFSLILITLVNVWYASKGWKLYKTGDTASAKKLMYASFAYLPIVLILFIIGSNGI
jgi:protoheme IX farnesyltransferase